MGMKSGIYGEKRTLECVAARERGRGFKPGIREEKTALEYNGKEMRRGQEAD